MKHILEIIGDLIWSTYLDENEWWMKAQMRSDAIFTQPGVIRR